MTESKTPYHSEGESRVLFTQMIGDLRVEVREDGLRLSRGSRSFFLSITEFEQLNELLDSDQDDVLEEEDDGELPSAPSDFLQR